MCPFRFIFVSASNDSVVHCFLRAHASHLLTFARAPPGTDSRPLARSTSALTGDRTPTPGGYYWNILTQGKTTQAAATRRVSTPQVFLFLFEMVRARSSCNFVSSPACTHAHVVQAPGVCVSVCVCAWACKRACVCGRAGVRTWSHLQTFRHSVGLPSGLLCTLPSVLQECGSSWCRRGTCCGAGCATSRRRAPPPPRRTAATSLTSASTR